MLKYQNKNKISYVKYVILYVHSSLFTISPPQGSNHLPDVYYHEIHKMLHEHKKSVRHV
jgi:hypothetical protein